MARPCGRHALSAMGRSVTESGHEIPSAAAEERAGASCRSSACSRRAGPLSAACPSSHGCWILRQHCTKITLAYRQSGSSVKSLV